MPLQPIVFRIAMFRKLTDPVHTAVERERSQKGLLWLMEALAAVNVTFLKQEPETPSIYTGVPNKPICRYQAEDGTEEWRDIPTLLADGFGDCEDLQAARVAELRIKGVVARPWIKWVQMPGGGYLYHAVVWRNSITSNLPPVKEMRGHNIITAAPAPWGGFLEDPSRVLGM